MAIDSLISELNDQQLKAVKQVDGYVNLNAGAGSGKSKVIVARTGYMIDQGINPDSILVLTFGKAASREVKRRIGDALGKIVGERVNAMNFHSFCVMILNAYAKYVGFESPITVLSSSEQADVFQKLVRVEIENRISKDLNVFDDDLRNVMRQFPMTKSILNVYSDWRNNPGSALSDYIDSLYDRLPSLDEKLSDYVAESVAMFNECKKSRNAMDFEDLLYYTVMLFENNESVRAHVENKFRYIMCDEYQDTNLLQDYLLDLISRNVRNVFVVGDRNQSIYAFRGADVRNILSFASRHKGTLEMDLPLNYRSSNEILDCANAVINHAGYNANAHMIGRFNGKKPEVVLFDDDFAEARWIVEDVLCRHERDGLDLNKMAVLFRGGNLTSLIEMELRKKGIPFEKMGGTSFFERDHIVNILALLKMAVSVQNDLAWLRGLSLIRGIGDKSSQFIYGRILEEGVEFLLHPGKKFVLKSGSDMNLLYQMLQECEGHSPSYCIDVCGRFYQMCREYQIRSRKSIEDSLKDEAKLKDQLNDIRDLSTIAGEYVDVQDFLNDCSLSASAKDMVNDDEKKFMISTVHSAKGLEWDIVYVVGALEHVFPSLLVRNNDELDEERRCMYVAITRASKELYFTFPVSTSKVDMRQYGNAELSSFLQFPDVMATVNTVSKQTSGYSGYDDSYRRRGKSWNRYRYGGWR